MDETIEDGIGQGRHADHIVPAVDRHLAGEEDGASVVTILDDLEEIAACSAVNASGPQSSRMSSLTRASEREGGQELPRDNQGERRATIRMRMAPGAG